MNDRDGPGPPRTRQAVDDERLIGWIARAHETSQWTTSTCTGSLLLGAAGVAEAIQLMIEYDPQPPLDAGSPRKAPLETVEKIREVAEASGLLYRTRMAGPATEPARTR